VVAKQSAGVLALKVPNSPDGIDDGEARHPCTSRCITLGIYSSICRHLAKYRLAGWSFPWDHGTHERRSEPDPGTIGERQSAREGGEGGSWHRAGAGILPRISIGPMRQWGPSNGPGILGSSAKSA